MNKIIKEEIPKILEYINNNKIKGDHQIVAEESNCSVNTVYMILQNPSYTELSIKILENFVSILQKRQDKIISINEKIFNQ